MSSPGFDSVIPGLGRSILGSTRKPAGAVGQNTGAPVANERRSRSRSDKSAERAEHTRKDLRVEGRAMDHSLGHLPVISDELRNRIMAQGQPPGSGIVGDYYRPHRTNAGPPIRGRGQNSRGDRKLTGGARLSTG